MQPVGEILEDGVPGIGRDALDDQLIARDAQRQLAPLREQRFEPARDALGRRDERRVAAGIHRVLVEGDRELAEEVGQIARQRRALRFRLRRARFFGRRRSVGLARVRHGRRVEYTTYAAQ